LGSEECFDCRDACGGVIRCDDGHHCRSRLSATKAPAGSHKALIRPHFRHRRTLRDPIFVGKTYGDAIAPAPRAEARMRYTEATPILNSSAMASRILPALASRSTSAALRCAVGDPLALALWLEVFVDAPLPLPRSLLPASSAGSAGIKLYRLIAQAPVVMLVTICWRLWAARRSPCFGEPNTTS
jgi:hypothetical protein